MPGFVIQQHDASRLHSGGGDKPQWLLNKPRDEGADARRNPASTRRESVRNGRTIEDVAPGG